MVFYALLGLLSMAFVWAQTLGGQTFPRYERMPLVQASLPSLMKGDVARNLGMLVGLPGWSSLIPLLLGLMGQGWHLWRAVAQTAGVRGRESRSVDVGVPERPAGHSRSYQGAWRFEGEDGLRM